MSKSDTITALCLPTTQSDVDWRQALKDGQTVGAIWTGRGKITRRRMRQHRVDPEKTAVAVGNQFGAVHAKVYKDHAVVLIKGPDGRTIKKFRYVMRDLLFQEVPVR